MSEVQAASEVMDLITPPGSQPGDNGNIAAANKFSAEHTLHLAF